MLCVQIGDKGITKNLAKVQKFTISQARNKLLIWTHGVQKNVTME